MLGRSVLCVAVLGSLVTSCTGGVSATTEPDKKTELEPPPCALPADSPDREWVETRCDGIDNDCDGLVDVLLPVEANLCQGAGESCAQGHAACEGTTRTCYAPAPAPEVFDGVDNDCNGAVDDVAAVNVRSRALLLVPNYLWEESPADLDTVASIMEQWGIPYDRPQQGADWGQAFETLDRYALVFVPNYLMGSLVDATKRSQLEAFAASGGVVVITRPVEGTPGEGFPLAGLARSTRRMDVESIAFDGAAVTAARAFDSPEERRVPLADDVTKTPIEAYTMEPSDANTQVVAHAIVGGAPVGAIVTRRKVGRGSIYAIGHDLYAFAHTRCYVNCFEPSGDLIGLFLREALREGTSGHLVLKHTVPGPEDSVMMLTHDVDAPDAHKSGSWGAPGAVQTARLEVDHHARGTFLVTTDYVTPYYSEAMVRELCQLGMCPLGAHSVRHADNFDKQRTGTCDEVHADYSGDLRTTTLCGEVRVSKEILEQATGGSVVAWRSPYLYVHPELYDVLESQGFVADSSFGVGDLKFNLPVSLARTGLQQNLFHHRRVYTFPIAIEDGIGWIENGVEMREEMQPKNAGFFLTMWSYAMMRNADNGSVTTALLHPSYGRGVGPDNLKYKLAVTAKFLDYAQARKVRMDLTMGEMGIFWRAREGTELEARYDADVGYTGSLAVGQHAVTGLTLEFGDAVGSFECSTCGRADISGRRVTLAGALAEGSRHTFIARAKR
jgi:hypothetical protein